MGVVTGNSGKIRLGRLLAGSVGKWKFEIEEKPEIVVDSYFLNKYWYEPGKIYTLELKCGNGSWFVPARIPGKPQVGRLLNSRLIFDAQESPSYIKK